jgi:hypothetical protein
LIRMCSSLGYCPRSHELGSSERNNKEAFMSAPVLASERVRLELTTDKKRTRSDASIKPMIQVI